MSYLVNPYMVTPADPVLSGDTDLKAYWKFSESSGTINNVSQASADLGSDANITMSGGTYSQTGTPANFGTALRFDGTDDYGYCGSSTSQFNFLHNQSALWTVCFWRKTLTLGTVNYFCDTCFTESTQVGFLARTESDNSIRWHISRGQDYTRPLSFVTSADYIPDATDWHLYICAYDYNGSAPQAFCRRDNANEETSTNTGDIPSNSNSTFPLIVGARDNNAGGHTNFFDGEYCEWSIWNKIVSDDDLSALYNDGKGLEIY